MKLKLTKADRIRLVLNAAIAVTGIALTWISQQATVDRGGPSQFFPILQTGIASNAPGLIDPRVIYGEDERGAYLEVTIMRGSNKNITSVALALPGTDTCDAQDGLRDIPRGPKYHGKDFQFLRYDFNSSDVAIIRCPEHIEPWHRGPFAGRLIRFALMSPNPEYLFGNQYSRWVGVTEAAFTVEDEYGKITDVLAFDGRARPITAGGSTFNGEDSRVRFATNGIKGQSSYFVTAYWSEFELVERRDLALLVEGATIALALGAFFDGVKILVESFARQHENRRKVLVTRIRRS
jgi:hypothetical protein